MAVELATAYISILPEMKSVAPMVRKELSAVEREAGKVGKKSGEEFSTGFGGIVGGSAKKMFAPVIAAAGALGGIKFFGDAIDQASALAESTNKMANVFGKAAKDVEKFAKGGARALGMTELQAREAASTFGVFGKAAKLQGPALSKFSTGLVKLATDLASFHDSSPEEAISAIGSALRGEAEPMRKYGVLLDDASMRQEAVRQGLIKTTKTALEPQQKVLAAHALIMRQTKDATDDFSETSDGLANSSRILTATWSDMKARLGELLLPLAEYSVGISVKAVEGISSFVTSFANSDNVLKTFTSSLTDGETVMNVFRTVMDSLSASPFIQWLVSVTQEVWGKLQPAFVSLANVFTSSIVPAFKDIGVAILAFINSPLVGHILGVLRPILMGFINGVILAVRGLVNVFTGVLNVIAGLFTGNWTRVFEGAKQIVVGAVQFIIGVFQSGLVGRIGGIFAAFAGLFGRLGAPIVNFFRTILPGALNMFTTAAAGMVSKILGMFGSFIAAILGRVITPLRTWFGTIIPGVLRAMGQIFTLTWTGAGNVVTGVVQRVIIGPLTAIRSWFSVLIPAYLRFMAGVWRAIFNAIWAVVSAVWNRTLGAVFRPLATWVRNTIPSALNFFGGVASRVFGLFGRVVGAARDVALAAFTRIVNGMRSMGDWARTVVDGIGKTFSLIKGAIEAPVRYVINNIIRDKLASAWNSIAERLNLPRWDFPGWADGGWTGPGRKYQPAGIVHADEYVIRKESQRRLRRERPGLLDYLNRHGTLPPGYAIGGRVRGLDPEFYKRLAAWNAATGGRYSVSSGYRSIAEQTALWNRSDKSGRMVARPGGSKHNYGLAADLAPPTTAAHRAMARQFGLYFPMSYEPWHIQLVGAGSGVSGGVSLPNPVATLLKKIIAPLFNGARSLISGIAGLFGNSDAARMAAAYARIPVDAAEKWLTSKIDAVFPALLGAVDESVGNIAASSAAVGMKAATQQAATRYGWNTGTQWKALDWVVTRESGWNPNAKNPRSTAYGAFQFLDSTWGSVGARKTASPAGQAAAGLAYIATRYGNPAAAQAFWRRNGWYAQGGRVRPVDHLEVMDRGGILRPGVSLVANYTGRPEMVRTWEQEQALRRGTGTQVTINGIKHDSVGEFAQALNYALARADNRSRYAGVM